mmetsp:Transcript_73644/g.213332  ORF Transcript_73644/g.213332 Transcript_73644/m.213332 type:complete len:230 (+) Transcript_73644:848-1537(+)
MPATSADISDSKVEMLSFASSMTVSTSAIERSRPFILSSAASSSCAQYSFFSSSSACSFFNVATSSSTSLITFSNPAFLPCKASAIKSNWCLLLCGARARASVKIAFAWARMDEAVTRNCKKLAPGLGKVALKRSSASSSLSNLIVSASATVSCARILFSSSWTLALESQFFSMSARNALSCSKASTVSPRSFFIVEICTPNSADLWSFPSMDFDTAATSFSLEAISPS